MTWDRKHSLLQNVAAISGDFHTHKRYGKFYETFGKNVNGFVGIYEICIGMAEALTDWETKNGRADAYGGHGLQWIEIVEQFVADTINHSIENGFVMNAHHCLLLRSVIKKAKAQ